MPKKIFQQTIEAQCNIYSVLCSKKFYPVYDLLVITLGPCKTVGLIISAVFSKFHKLPCPI